MFTWGEFVLFVEAAELDGLIFGLFGFGVAHGELIVFFLALAGQFWQVEEYFDGFYVSDGVDHHASGSFGRQG